MRRSLAMCRDTAQTRVMRWIAALFCFCCATASDAGETVRLDAEMLTPAPPYGWLATGLDVPEPDPNLPIVDPTDRSAEAQLLRRLDARGVASGFAGVLYENRDRAHSVLEPDLLPRLGRLDYADALVARGIDYGLGGEILFPAIVIGNSSTAVTKGPAPRSQPRLAMTRPLWPERAYRTHAANHLYVYPEHRDHDSADLFPAMWPYTVISQGSSGSDRRFLRALLMTVAAFPKDTRDVLVRNGLVAPTLQMILRRSQPGIRGRAAYMTGAAHPTAFNGRKVPAERMVALAAAIAPSDVPPLVRLRVESEDFADSAGLAGLSEKLFDTPSAIARLWRSEAYTRRITLSAEDTHDPNGRTLSFTWAVLHGDPSKVRIRPLDPDGHRAEIEIDWQSAYPVEPGGDRMTSRVDIGVFAWNGAHDSAPAFLSVQFPTHQQRGYTRTPDGIRLISIDYDAAGRGAYFDPYLYWSAPWSDRIDYGPAGEAIRTRTMPDGEITLTAPDRLSDGRTASYDVEGRGQKRTLRMKIAKGE